MFLTDSKWNFFSKDEALDLLDTCLTRQAA